MAGSGLAFGALGDIPTVNTVQNTGSNLSLNLTAAGTHQQLGLFLVNSNDATGFHITFSFQNKGFFKAGTRQIALTNIVLNKVSGTLGGGLVEPINTPIVLDGSGNWTWSPCPPAPTTETDSYFVEIAADWTDASGGIAGFYYEKINAVIVSGP
ncbi:MAG TPA: hypothetical protein VJ385_22215 [Fibrobacteria bacterium]|nr:hypothetical protein [Fibrobacteria bacterium]